MGDIVHALPAITALRKIHPAWVIDWAVEPQWQALLTTPGAKDPSQERSEARPLVDHIHTVPTKHWAKHPFSASTRTEIGSLRSELKACAYDAVLDLQGAIRSATVARLTGCSRVIGERNPREKLAAKFYHEKVETFGEHVIEQDCELASSVAGDLLTPSAAMLPVDEEAEDWCDQLEDVQIAEWSGKPLVLIHPGAGWGAKRWPTERYGAVAYEFTNRGAKVLVNAAPGEEALAAAVVEASDGCATLVQSSLSQLIALTRRITVAIGGDTGPNHLASAMDKLVVGIYGPTDPKRNGPYSLKSRALRNPDSRNDHSRREEPEAGLLTITPEEVMAAAAELMLNNRLPARATQRDAGRDLDWESERYSESEPNRDGSYSPKPRVTIARLAASTPIKGNSELSARLPETLDATPSIIMEGDVMDGDVIDGEVLGGRIIEGEFLNRDHKPSRNDDLGWAGTEIGSA